MTDASSSHPAPPTRRRPSGCALGLLALVALVVFTVVVVVSLTAAGLIGRESDAEKAKILTEVERDTGIATSNPDTDQPPQRDLRVGRCEADPEGALVAGGSVTNFTDQPASYQISVVFLEGSGSAVGAELAATTVDVAGVASERTVNWSSTADVAPPGDFTCRVVRIERSP